MTKKIEFFNSLYEDARILSEIRIYNNMFAKALTLFINREDEKYVNKDYYINNSKSLKVTFK